MDRIITKFIPIKKYPER